MTRRLLTHVILGIGALLITAPILVLLYASFRPERLMFAPFSLDFTFANYTAAWQQADWIRYLFNTVLASGVTLLLQYLFCLPAGWVLARVDFRGRRFVLGAVIFALAVPMQAITVPLYVGLSGLHALDNPASLILPFIGSAFGIFLFRQFLLTVPQSVVDAARVDGVGQIALIWRVVIPAAKPAMIAFGAFSLIGHWNDLYWPTVTLRTDQWTVLSAAVGRFASPEFGLSYGIQTAAALMTVLPMLIVYLLVQRHLTDGLALSDSHSGK